MKLIACETCFAKLVSFARHLGHGLSRNVHRKKVAYSKLLSRCNSKVSMYHQDMFWPEDVLARHS